MALTSALLFASFIASASSAFDVAPYLHVRPGEGLFLGWVATSDVRHAQAATFRTPAGDVIEVDVIRQGDVSLASLPWACDVPEGATYQVAGQMEAVALPRWPCHPDAPVRLGFLTDTQQDLAIAQRASMQLSSEHLDALIHGGDMVQWGGSDAQWTSLLAAMAPSISKTPLVVAAGNHDFFWDADGEHLGQYFGVQPPRSWYRTRVGAIQLIVLDSSHATSALGVAQRSFLRAALQSDAPWKIVIFHHALFSEGIAHSPWAKAIRTQAHDVVRALMLDDIEQLGADLVLTGHTHLFERSRKSHIEYVVGGPAGGMLGLKGGENPWSLRSDAQRSLSVIEADAHRLTVRTTDLDGNVLDTFHLEKDARVTFHGSMGGLGRRLPRHVEP